VSIALVRFVFPIDDSKPDIRPLYFLEIEGQWKIAPTMNEPPMEPEYKAAVEALQNWLEVERGSFSDE